MSLPKGPEVSVIIASYRSQETIRDCLISLDLQTAKDRFEIIVVDSSNDGIVGPIVNEFPDVRLYTFPCRKYCGDARNFGISVALADIVAFIDADCVADKDWIERILEAHSSGDVAIGGSIACRIPENYVGWAAYFTEFSQWMPKTKDTHMDDIAGANMSYKKRLFAQFGRFIENTYCSDTEFHWRLKKAGISLKFAASIRVAHRNVGSLFNFLKHEFHHGRYFANVRMQYAGFRDRKRWIYGILCSFIPLRLFAKILICQMKNKIYLFQFIATLPLLFLGLMFWSLGEASAYLVGSQTAR